MSGRVLCVGNSMVNKIHTVPAQWSSEVKTGDRQKQSHEKVDVCWTLQRIRKGSHKSEQGNT